MAANSEPAGSSTIGVPFRNVTAGLSPYLAAVGGETDAAFPNPEGPPVPRFSGNYRRGDVGGHRDVRGQHVAVQCHISLSGLDPEQGPLTSG